VAALLDLDAAQVVGVQLVGVEVAVAVGVGVAVGGSVGAGDAPAGSAAAATSPSAATVTAAACRPRRARDKRVMRSSSLKSPALGASDGDAVGRL